MIKIIDDYTLMSPFGRTPTRAPAMTDERWEAIGRYFRNGPLKQDVVQSYASDDMVVLAVMERANVEVGGLPAQDWSLRVTLAFPRRIRMAIGASARRPALSRRQPLERAALAGNSGEFTAPECSPFPPARPMIVCNDCLGLKQ